MKIKVRAAPVNVGLWLLLAIMFASLIGCVSGPFSSNLNGSPPYDKPTWNGDDPTPPVYKSPAVIPATTNLPT